MVVMRGARQNGPGRKKEAQAVGSGWEKPGKFRGSWGPWLEHLIQPGGKGFREGFSRGRDVRRRIKEMCQLKKKRKVFQVGAFDISKGQTVRQQ